MSAIPPLPEFPFGLDGIDWAGRTVLVAELRKNLGCIQSTARNLRTSRNRLYSCIKRWHVDSIEFAQVMK